MALIHATPLDSVNDLLSKIFGVGFHLYTMPYGSTSRQTAVSTIYELHDGNILAGNEDGTHYKGDFYRGGQLLISRDGGISWESLVDRSDWHAINEIYENKDGFLFVWVEQQGYVNTPPDLQVSPDRGNSWHPFAETHSAGREQTYCIVGEELLVVARHLPSGDNWVMVTSTDVMDLKLD